MLATYSFKARSPRTQDCASASEGHTRSRLFLAPLKTTVKHRLSCPDPDRRLSDSDWQPSRTHSTSVTATGREKKSPEWVGDHNNTHGVKQLKSDTAICKNITYTLRVLSTCNFYDTKWHASEKWTFSLCRQLLTGFIAITALMWWLVKVHLWKM